MFSTAQGLMRQVASSKSGEILPPEAFARALRLERKRTERSGKSFLLALLDLSETQPAEHGPAHARVAAALGSSVRETDVVGWYEQDAVVGVIFTHLQESSRGAVRDAVDARLAQACVASALAQKAGRVRISYHFFPESESDAGNPVTELEKSQGHAIRTAQALKRTIDIVGGLFCLLAFSPLFLAIAVLIKVGSRGPVFFRQTRLGHYGKLFTFLKFRSMYVDNDSAIHRDYVEEWIAGRDVARSDATNKNKRVFKIVDDPRVTTVGRWLRKTSLDELPQFINVLKGEMSLVGPRPPVPYEFERYAMWHRRRIMEAKPGISGLWQVTGRSRTTFDEMVRLDLQYARNWSLWLDFKILLRTPAAVISGDGAY